MCVQRISSLSGVVSGNFALLDKLEDVKRMLRSVQTKKLLSAYK